MIVKSRYYDFAKIIFESGAHCFRQFFPENDGSDYWKYLLRRQPHSYHSFIIIFIFAQETRNVSGYDIMCERIQKWNIKMRYQVLVCYKATIQNYVMLQYWTYTGINQPVANLINNLRS